MQATIFPHPTKSSFTYQDIQDGYQKKERRETWDETVARYFDFFTEHLKETVNFTLSKELRTELEQAVLGLRVMSSHALYHDGR